MRSDNKDFYVYASSSLAIAPAGFSTDTVNIEADSDFILQKLTVFADVAAAGQTASSRILPLVALQLTDTGSGRQIFSDSIPVPGLFGDGSLPFILPNPRRFSSNSVITLNYNNYDAALTYNVYLQLIGIKVYK